MSKRKPPETDAELLAALAELFDEVETESGEETSEVLRTAGYDLDALDKEIGAIVDEAAASSPLNWRNKQSQMPATHFRNYEEMTDEDLASWLMELTFLMDDNNLDKDSDAS